MDAAERARLIRRYEEGPEVLAAALDGLSEGDLDRRPAPDAWTPREIAHHTADSETTLAIRLRKLIVEDDAMIQGYDEVAFARALFYDRPIGPSLDAVRAARATTAQILARLSEEQWRRSGTHSESGAYDVETWLRIYADHCHDHAEQIRRAVRGEV